MIFGFMLVMKSENDFSVYSKSVVLELCTMPLMLLAVSIMKLAFCQHMRSVKTTKPVKELFHRMNATFHHYIQGLVHIARFFRFCVRKCGLCI